MSCENCRLNVDVDAAGDSSDRQRDEEDEIWTRGMPRFLSDLCLALYLNVDSKVSK